MIKKVSKISTKKRASSAAKKAMKDASVDARTTRKKRATAGTQQQRTAWTGLTREEMQQPGAQLLVLLVQKANESGHTLSELAGELGVTYGYLSQLRNGTRQWRHISDEFANACAQYLGMPRLTVLLACGRVQVEDFYDDPELVRDHVSRAMTLIKQDPDYAALIPGDIDAASYEYKRLVALLYERATGLSVLPEAADVDSLIAQLKKLK